MLIPTASSAQSVLLAPLTIIAPGLVHPRHRIRCAVRMPRARVSRRMAHSCTASRSRRVMAARRMQIAMAWASARRAALVFARPMLIARWLLTRGAPSSDVRSFRAVLPGKRTRMQHKRALRRLVAAPSTTDAHGDALGTGLEHSGVEANGGKLCPRAVASSYEEIARWQNKRGRAARPAQSPSSSASTGRSAASCTLSRSTPTRARAVQLRRQESTARGSTDTPGGYMSASCKSA